MTARPQPLKGTYLVAQTDAAGKRVELMDTRRPQAGGHRPGRSTPPKANVTTYKLVGPQYFNFFAIVMAAVGVLFILVAALYKERNHLREDATA